MKLTVCDSCKEPITKGQEMQFSITRVFQTVTDLAQGSNNSNTINRADLCQGCFKFWCDCTDMVVGELTAAIKNDLPYVPVASKDNFSVEGLKDFLDQEEGEEDEP